MGCFMWDLLMEFFLWDVSCRLFSVGWIFLIFSCKLAKFVKHSSISCLFHVRIFEVIVEVTFFNLGPELPGIFPAGSF